MVDVSVVIGSYNRQKYLKSTIDTVRKELISCEGEIIVIDGGSDDGSLEWLVHQKYLLTIVQYNRGTWMGRDVERKSWGYFMNLGFRSARGKYVCMISDDCLVVPGAILNGCSLFEKQLNQGNKLGAVAFYWRNWPEQKKYWVGLTLGNKMFVNHGLFLKSALEEVGYADEKTYLFYHADGDMCLKMWQKGYSVIDSPDSYIEHHSHVNESVRKSNLEAQQKDWKSYLAKWQGIYFDPLKNNIGKWIEKEYNDPDKTAMIYNK